MYKLVSTLGRLHELRISRKGAPQVCATEQGCKAHQIDGQPANLRADVSLIVGTGQSHAVNSGVPYPSNASAAKVLSQHSFHLIRSNTSGRTPGPVPGKVWTPLE